MLQHYQHFWLNAKLKFALTSLITIFSVTKVQGPVADVELDQPVTGSQQVTAYHSIILKPGFSVNSANGSFKATIVTNPSLSQSITPAVPMDAAPSQDQNYVVTFTPRVAVTSLSELSTTADVMESVQYNDGLGRPSQTVQVRGNFDASGDVVQHIDYDEYGRERKKYLPYVDRNLTPGSFKADAAAAVTNYYAAPPSQSNVTQNNYPFAEANFEPSPLDRVVEQGAPGLDWQLGQGHTNKLSYDVNIANDVRIYTAEADEAIDEEYKRSLSSSGYYPAGELYLTIVKNENWVSSDGKENTTEEYKDKKGRVVLKRKFDANGLPLSTYYVYDYRGNLCFVLPPKANPDVTGSAMTQVILNELCYQYYYDSKNRLIEKKVPGKSWEYNLYNSLDQLVGTQDGHMGGSGRHNWKFFKYDYLGRVVMTGLLEGYYNEAVRDRIYMQNQIDQNTTNLFESRMPGNDYTNLAWPNSGNIPTRGSMSKLTVNYYDDYNIPGLPALYDHHAENSSLIKNLLTVTLTNVLNTSDMLWTVNYYDDLSRLTNVYAQHYYLGLGNASVGNYDHIINTYNFDNQIHNSVREHFILENSTPVNFPIVKVSNEFKYDHTGRKRQTWEQISSNHINNTNVGTIVGTNVLLSQTDYNDVGQPIAKHLHSVDDGGNFLQDISYYYNERGWQSRVHSPLFDEQLHYNNQNHGARINYNGNISEQDITTLSGNRYFTYAYDNLNRLKAGVSSGNNFSETDIQYDMGGNITQLKRNGNQLNYSYLTNSNKLKSLSGLISSVYDIQYDDNANLTMDYRSDKFALEDYNLLNLPSFIGGDQDMSVFYTVAGEKVETENNITGEAIEYIRGIHYKINSNIVLDYIQTEEGQAVPNGNGGFKYEYTLKDHLGNNRVNFDKDPSTLLARRIQETDYFPFGKSAVVYTFGGNKNQYLYNGKELVETLNEYDYGARYYDAEIARWKSIDPLVENSRRWSPYNYGYNNPISNIDPDGMEAGRFGEDKDLSDYNYEGAISNDDNNRKRGDNKNEGADNVEEDNDHRSNIDDRLDFRPDLEQMYIAGGGGGKKKKQKVKENSNTDMASGLPSVGDMKNSPPKDPGYVPPKGGARKGNSSRGRGWVDRNGNVWVPDDHNGSHAPHWDVQPPKGPGYTRVYPDPANYKPDEAPNNNYVAPGNGIKISPVVVVGTGMGIGGVIATYWWLGLLAL